MQKQLFNSYNFEDEYLGQNKPINKIIPVLSVLTVTYQHADYIGKCLDSLLSQETDFDYEILVGEDGSSDGTRATCISYADQNQSRIRLFLRDRDKTVFFDSNGDFQSTLNFVFLHKAARGRFVAICEGDDFWNDAKKLQAQVDFLSTHLEYSLSYHRVKTELVSEEARGYSYPEIEGENLSLGQGIEKHYIPTASIVFRASMLQLPQWYIDTRMKSGDIAISLSLLTKGPGYFHRSAMATYRRYTQSLTQTKVITDQLKVLNNYTFIFENLDKDSKGRFRHLFKKRILPHRNGIMVMSLKKGDIKTAFQSLFVILKYDPFYFFKRLTARISGGE